MLSFFIPEILLAFCIFFLLLFNSHFLSSGQNRISTINAEVAKDYNYVLFFLFFLSLLCCQETGSLLNFFIFDAGTNLVKSFFLFIAWLAGPIIWRASDLQKTSSIEYFILVLCIILASMLLLHVSNFLSLYLCLEMQTLCFYIICTLQRVGVLSSEAGLRYFISSSLMSCVYLLGCLIFYACFGTTSFSDISILMLVLEPNLLFYVKVGLFFFISVFFFKLNIAPFHFWFPQIYDGAPLSATIIFALIPKIILFTIFMRFYLICMPVILSFNILFLCVGTFSYGFGTLKALKQTRIKKLFIYSSIGQMGLPLCALTVYTLEAWAAVYFFICVYLITSLVMWGWFVLFISNKYKVLLRNNTTVIIPVFFSDLIGLFRYNFRSAFIFLIILFSLAGIPPLVGFISKFNIILSIISSSSFFFAILLVFISIIAAFYYIQLIKLMFFEIKILSIHTELQSWYFFTLDWFLLTFTFSFFFLLFLGFFPDILFLFCEKIVIFLETGIF